MWVETEAGVFLNLEYVVSVQVLPAAGGLQLMANATSGGATVLCSFPVGEGRTAEHAQEEAEEALKQLRSSLKSAGQLALVAKDTARKVMFL